MKINLIKKTRLYLCKKWYGKNIYIYAVIHGKYFLYNHDQTVDWVLLNSNVKNTKSWKVNGLYHFPSLPDDKYVYLKKWELKGPLPSSLVKDIPSSLR